MFCKKCGAQLADNATFCTQCGAPVANNTPAANAPIALPTGLNLKALVMKGVYALFALLTLIFWNGDTITVSAWGQSMSGPMNTVLKGADAGFINVFAMIFYIILLVWAIVSLAMPFVGNLVPSAVGKIFNKVTIPMILTILTIVLYIFGLIVCLAEARGMSLFYSGLGIFNFILHIANIVLLVLISKENKN